jgi:hypothetical protein
VLVKKCLHTLKEECIPRCNLFVYSDDSTGNQYWIDTGWLDPDGYKVLQKFTR